MAIFNLFCSKPAHKLFYVDILRQKTMRTKFLMVVLSLIVLETISITHYLVNGGFQTPILPAGTFLECDSILGWTGRFEMLNVDTFTLGLSMGQFLDLQRRLGAGQNGFMTQFMNISSDENICTLSLFQKARTTSFNYYAVQIYWNQKYVSTQIPVTTNVTHHEFKLTPASGLNNLTFKQVGEDRYDADGLYLDNISLSCQYIPKVD